MLPQVLGREVPQTSVAGTNLGIFCGVLIFSMGCSVAMLAQVWGSPAELAGAAPAWPGCPLPFRLEQPGTAPGACVARRGMVCVWSTPWRLCRAGLAPHAAGAAAWWAALAAWLLPVRGIAFVLVFGAGFMGAPALFRRWWQHLPAARSGRVGLGSPGAFGPGLMRSPRMRLASPSLQGFPSSEPLCAFKPHRLRWLRRAVPPRVC